MQYDIWSLFLVGSASLLPETVLGRQECLPHLSRSPYLQNREVHSGELERFLLTVAVDCLMLAVYDCQSGAADARNWGVSQPLHSIENRSSGVLRWPGGGETDDLDRA